MNVLRKLLPPLLTVLLAAAAVLLPPSLSRLRDSLALSGVHLEEETLVPAASELSVEEKLELISLSRRDPSGVIQSSQYYEASQNAEILQTVREEVNRLQETGLFPVQFPEQLDHSSTLVLVTYTDSTDLSRTVSVWEIAFYTNLSRLLVTADSVSGKIYEYSYTPNLDTSFAVDIDPQPGTLESYSTFLDGAADLETALRRFAAGLGVTVDEIDTEKAPYYSYAHVENSSVSYVLELEESEAFACSLSLVS